MTGLAERAAAVDPGLHVLNGSSVTRDVLVKPGMCGYNSLFLGRVGDWTWDTVSALCGTDAYTARTATGAPTYLSFYYFHVRGGPSLHVGGLSFGDRLRATSSLFDFGSESVLALHRIGPVGGPAEPVDPDDFYAYADPSCLYVENFNRWIARSEPGSNRDLVRASPVGFRHDHLPPLPARYSPRRPCQLARGRHTFLDGPPPDRRRTGSYTLHYPVDITRDLNGVGLLYFATYFLILDRGLLALWRHLGRPDRAFLERVVLDSKLCYLGNADAGATLLVEVTGWADTRDPTDELVEVVVRERDSGRAIAVACQHLQTPGGPW